MMNMMSKIRFKFLYNAWKFTLLQKRAKETSKRFQLRYITTSEDKWTLQNIADHILKTQNVVVMAGAGISTPSGLIDFRTPGLGLYSRLDRYHLPYAEAIFDITYFQIDQRPFFSLAKDIYPGNYRPNPVHYFVRLLQEKNKLLRMYTQNIDGLERLAGIRPEMLIEAHGTFSTATCISCNECYDGDKIKRTILSGEIPKCTNKNCKGIIKPDIVFFGEQLPEKFWNYIEDMQLADLLIVMGTSLEVEPFAGIAEAVSKETPRLLINREMVGSFCNSTRLHDVSQIGDVVEGIYCLTDCLGWSENLKELQKNEENIFKGSGH